MGVYYLDTSALVKLYVHEAGTEEMVQLASRSRGHTLAVLALTRVELRAALRKRERMGDVSHEAAEDALARVERHLQHRYLVQPVSDAVIEEAAGLLDRYPLRGYDALQLAGCLSLRFRVTETMNFVCSDGGLLVAAGGEGLSTFNPVAPA